jgi:hypothetical protein
MQTKNYNFLTNQINQMNMSFLIKIATLTNNSTMMELLKVTSERINDRLAEIDREFSAFRYDSLVSKFQRGDMTPLTSSNDFKTIYNSAILAEQMTNGVYKPYFAGKFDPSEIVKSWAIEEVFDQNLKPLLNNPEVVGIYLESEGRIKFSTKQNSDFRWDINIKTPFEETDSLTTYYLKNGAIATTTDADLGNSLKTDRSDIQQATVIRNSLVESTIWSLVGNLVSETEFMSYIAHYNLTGILLDRRNEVLNYNLGSVIDHKENAIEK